ncbi:MAG: NUDIX hydrolase [Desulfarculaceae bacterium]|nr:NUDIX hydrolase [Desulfarculaceae bacterium]MCF8049253.1 NUDIX hydrolase [Desulfarculaceae bacterium]MCF8065341.1 NUDIX hydrolase [Desulfarculaceae bacterium]MCF8098796.1 NUDIX hydrolase [Desulfarculaceae bacterium]MCF8124109.1 NUDIX hydrolase [Desulfarculaceae bacterium]
MGRHYPELPVVGVGGVVLAGDQVLLVKRGAEPSKGIWSIPGGGVEVGESLVQACAREVAEETALDVRVGPMVEVLERILRDPQGRVEYHYVLIDFLCYAQPLEPQAGDDAAAALWAGLDALESFSLTPDTKRVILKAARLAQDG